MDLLKSGRQRNENSRPKLPNASCETERLIIYSPTANQFNLFLRLLLMRKDQAAGCKKRQYQVSCTEPVLLEY